MACTLTIDSLDYQARGVAREDGKVWFVEGALPGETVLCELTQSKSRFNEAATLEVIQPSVDRVVPECPYYTECGGCALQHLGFAAQVRYKQMLWREQLQRMAGVEPQEMADPIVGTPWRYRARTRLSVEYTPENVRIGFKARQSHQVVAIADCPVLDEQLAQILPKLPDFLQALRPRQVRGLSLHRGDSVCALALEMEGAVAEDIWQKLVTPLDGQWQLWVNNQCVIGKENQLFYSPVDNLEVAFTPVDFTQVNPKVNRAMVQAVCDSFKNPSETQVMDFFAGLGNFTFPLAQSGAQVVAVEGVTQMVKRGQTIAKRNALGETVHFQRSDLFKLPGKLPSVWNEAEIWVLDPPRAGAQALIARIPDSGRVKQVIYVSCNPATLARDAKILAGKGFRLARAQVVNMFAQTAHVESISWFYRE